jgi:hypothetical protein
VLKVLLFVIIAPQRLRRSEKYDFVFVGVAPCPCGQPLSYAVPLMCCGLSGLPFLVLRALPAVAACGARWHGAVPFFTRTVLRLVGAAQGHVQPRPLLRYGPAQPQHTGILIYSNIS